jgi:hypothetical protein
MRDPMREQMSAERYADLSEADLIAMAKHLNREVLRRGVALGRVYLLPPRAAELVNIGRTRSQAHQARQALRDVRFELVRRRYQSPPAGPIVNVGPIKQINAESRIDIGTQTGGSATGLDIGMKGE